MDVPNTGRIFELVVADHYRKIGAPIVEHDVEMAGNQIDVYVELRTNVDHSRHRLAIEAKDYNKPIGVKIVLSYSEVVKSLRGLGEIDEGAIVSRYGFTKQARTLARYQRIKLLVVEDLEAMVDQMTKGTRAVVFNINPGTSSPEEVGELLSQISRLYSMIGGSGLDFKPISNTNDEENHDN